MNSSIELTAADGHRLGAYVATPAGTPRAGLVVVQEIFGVNAHIRAVADGYAREGYLAVAPALFDRIEPGVELGYEASDVQRGRQLKDQADNAKALLDLAVAVEHASRAGKVGIVGYCWGGLLSWLAACRLDGLSAAVTYYGGGMTQHAGMAPKCPVLSHFGERDPVLPLDEVELFRAAHPEIELRLYPAGHGFNCDQRGSYDAPSAGLARERSLAFFARHLG